MHGLLVRSISGFVALSLLMGSTCLVVPKRAHAESPLSNNVKSGYFNAPHKDWHAPANIADDNHSKKKSHATNKMHRILHSTQMLDEACGVQSDHDATTFQSFTVVTNVDHFDFFTTNFPTILGAVAAQSPPWRPLDSKVQLIL